LKHRKCLVARHAHRLQSISEAVAAHRSALRAPGCAVGRITARQAAIEANQFDDEISF
jgi:hypothetical protein